MNMDKGYHDLPSFESLYSNTLELGNIPDDYFYSNEYDYLTLPEVQLLLILSDSQISYSFSGLRKTTSLHQHQLTKALKRLQDRSYLSKRDNGTYELTDSGSEYTKELLRNLLKNKAVNIQDTMYYSRWNRIKLIPPLDKNQIVSIFEKRWFGKFRFQYRREKESNIELCWEDSDNNKVHLYISNNGLMHIEYRSNQQDFPEMNNITNWLRNEIANLSDIKVDILDISISENISKDAYN